ncbi:MAG: hypothetical protein M0T85_06395 [Dehalococcoidales bacterium]|nr:hypothetical protein [Dehalococcoidales bacterium]
MVIASPYGAAETRDISQGRKIGIDEFVAVGIDDLAKYRIVQLLCSRPDTYWDAAEYAERLGLRPIERTVAELDELVGRHILEKQDADGLARYRLTTDRGLRRDVVRVLSLAQAPLRRGRVLARLASGSLERAKREAGRNKRGRPARCAFPSENCGNGDIR